MSEKCGNFEGTISELLVIHLSAVVGFSSERSEQLQGCLNLLQKHRSLSAVALED